MVVICAVLGAAFLHLWIFKTYRLFVISKETFSVVFQSGRVDQRRRMLLRTMLVITVGLMVFWFVVLFPPLFFVLKTAKLAKRAQNFIAI